MVRKIFKILFIISVLLTTNTAFAYDMLLDDFSMQSDEFFQKQGTYKEKTVKQQEKNDTVSNTIQQEVKADNPNEKELTAPEKRTDIEVYSDFLQYYPERYEFEAIGNAHISIPQENATLWADKLIFNRDTNTIKGFGNVLIKKVNSEATGDYVQINLNSGNALLENPIMDEYNVKIVAKESNFYPGKMVAKEGTMTTDESTELQIGYVTFGDFMESNFPTIKRTKYMKEKYNDEYTIKAKVIEVRSLKDNDELILKGADIYLKKIKIASAPRIRVLADKSQTFIETNLPEIGSLKQFGFYFGPGYVFNLPSNATLKVAAVALTSDGKWGIGGIARFRNQSNVTEAAWGTVKQDWIIRGEQHLTENSWLQYSYNGYMNEWFFGDRIPGKLIQYVYHKKYDLDHDMNYIHRLSMGAATDQNSNNWAGRFRYQGEFRQTLFSRVNVEQESGIHIGYHALGEASLYTTGDTHALLQAGPFIRTEYKNWVSNITYNFGAEHGGTPFDFDRYMYGKQNIEIMEMLRLHKYLAVAYKGVFVLLKDNWENSFLQENRFFVVIGPDDAKINLGYDTVRQRSILELQLKLGTDNTKVDFKKMVVTDPETLAKDESKTKEFIKKTKLKIMEVFMPDDLEKLKQSGEDL